LEGGTNLLPFLPFFGDFTIRRVGRDTDVV